MTTRTETILQLAQQRRVLRAADVRAAGGSPQLLLKLYQVGKLQRLSRGLYSLPGNEPIDQQNLLEVCQRVPKAVLCLQSALWVHGLVARPAQVWVALPAGTQTPSFTEPPLHVVRLGGASYSEGVQTPVVDGVTLRVYSLAKTVADCFKFRNKIGLDVALHALKSALDSGQLNLDELREHARTNRVERVMQPYLDAVQA